ncbi:MAG: prepilin-type N-terminal cleavage/methylation domain-containing protein [Candidatus Riflebacteria bacterium]|nr:prepilin-type N-terminal cleavage/methylation domain-containing protein [Candidatus Riflebacteria bacterium]
MSRRAVTLIEVMVAVLVGGILSVALTRLLTSTIRVSQKGSSHLTNVQAAAILVARLEMDLVQAESVTITPDGGLDLAVRTGAGTMPVRYRPGEDQIGYIRRIPAAAAAGGEEAHPYARDQKVEVTLTPAATPPRRGFFLEVRVRSHPSGAEEHVIRRFIYPTMLPENREQDSLGWKRD